MDHRVWRQPWSSHHAPHRAHPFQVDKDRAYRRELTDLTKRSLTLTNPVDVPSEQSDPRSASSATLAIPSDLMFILRNDECAALSAFGKHRCLRAERWDSGLGDLSRKPRGWHRRIGCRLDRRPSDGGLGFRKGALVIQACLPSDPARWRLP